MRNFPQLASVVQYNCDISDARHAGDYGLCSFLLKMREYYRWENEVPLTRALPKDELGEWLTTRETHWNGIEADDFAPLALARGELDPFDADAANRELLPQGYVYGAGYGRLQKPVFFLGRLLRLEARAGFTILVSSCEYARELLGLHDLHVGVLGPGLQVVPGRGAVGNQQHHFAREQLVEHSLGAQQRPGAGRSLHVERDMGFRVSCRGHFGEPDL